MDPLHTIRAERPLLIAGRRDHSMWFRPYVGGGPGLSRESGDRLGYEALVVLRQRLRQCRSSRSARTWVSMSRPSLSGFQPRQIGSRYRALVREVRRRALFRSIDRIDDEHGFGKRHFVIRRPSWSCSAA